MTDVPHVEVVVEVLVDLLGVTVLAEEAAEDPHASEPDHLEGETGIGGTLALTVAWEKRGGWEEGGE